MNAKSLVKVKYAEGVIEYNTTFARMMENPLSDEYALLQKLKMENPTFLVRHRRIKTNPKKDTYKGLTYSYMRRNDNFMKVCRKTTIAESSVAVPNPLEKAMVDFSFSQRHDIPNLLSREFALPLVPEDHSEI